MEVVIKLLCHRGYCIHNDFSRVGSCNAEAYEVKSSGNKKP